jgi:DNA-binding NarL/FixJ family response regulator
MLWQYPTVNGESCMKYLIVDDHSLIRDAIYALLTGIDSEAQVFAAATAAEAKELLAANPGVDLALLDLNLPDADGIELLIECRATYPTLAVVMLSGERDVVTVRRALEKGAVGFIPKTEPRAVLASALALVLAGGVYVPREALGAAASVTPLGALEDASPTPISLGLTERQIEVLALIMKGRTNKHICRQLNLAEPTVKNHVTGILRALNVTNRTEAVLAVTSLGWNLGHEEPH